MSGVEATKIETSARDRADLLLELFARGFLGGLCRKQRRIGGVSYFSFTAAEHGPCGRIRAGHGCAQNEQEALVKCVAELYERRLLTDFYWKINSEVGKVRGMPPLAEFRSFQTSNGWAVHFEPDKAAQSAGLEALERHILLASYLVFGWRGFTKVDDRNVDGVRFLSLVSRYSCNGHRAGLVAAKSEQAPGVTFGYLCDSKERIFSSPKWNHALFESLEQLLSYLETGLDKIPEPSHAVEESAIYHLKTTWSEPDFSRNLSDVELPSVQPVLQNFDLLKEYGVPLTGCLASGGGLIPMYFRRTLTPDAAVELKKILVLNGITAEIAERHPVL